MSDNIVKLADETISAETLAMMSEKLSAVFRENGVDAAPIDSERASKLIERSEYGSIGLPYLLIKTMTEEGRMD